MGTSNATRCSVHDFGGASSLAGPMNCVDAVPKEEVGLTDSVTVVVKGACNADLEQSQVSILLTGFGTLAVETLSADSSVAADSSRRFRNAAMRNLARPDGLGGGVEGDLWLALG